MPGENSQSVKRLLQLNRLRTRHDSRLLRPSRHHDLALHASVHYPPVLHCFTYGLTYTYNFMPKIVSTATMSTKVAGYSFFLYSPYTWHMKPTWQEAELAAHGRASLMRVESRSKSRFVVRFYHLMLASVLLKFLLTLLYSPVCNSCPWRLITDIG